MFLRISILISAFILAQNLPVFSMQALEVKPQDIYQAAYCSELNRLAKYPNVQSTLLDQRSHVGRLTIGYSQKSQHDNSISDFAYRLITGGDNLDFVEIGINDAKREYLNSTSAQTKQKLINSIQVCADKLAEIIQSYEWMPCGYGRNRYNGSVEIKSYLQRLEIFIEPVVDTESALVLKWLLE